MSKEQLSVANDIKALALINIRDIFQFTLTATDADIKERYGSEESAMLVAEKYLDIALKSAILEHPLKGWSMNYSMPIKGSEKRKEYKACFYDVHDSESEGSEE